MPSLPLSCHITAGKQRGLSIYTRRATLECPVNGLKGRWTKKALKVPPVSEHSLNPADTRFRGSSGRHDGARHWAAAARSDPCRGAKPLQTKDPGGRGACVGDRKTGRWGMVHIPLASYIFHPLNLTDGRARERVPGRTRRLFEAAPSEGAHVPLRSRRKDEGLLLVLPLSSSSQSFIVLSGRLNIKCTWASRGGEH